MIDYQSYLIIELIFKQLKALKLLQKYTRNLLTVKIELTLLLEMFLFIGYNKIEYLENYITPNNNFLPETH